MQSQARTVTAYLREVPTTRRDALLRLRELCRMVLTDFHESMTYGMPCYSRNGEVEVAFASQKNFIGIYFLRTDVMLSHRYLLNIPGITFGKGCIRYPKPEKIDFGVIEKMLRATLASQGKVC